MSQEIVVEGTRYSEAAVAHLLRCIDLLKVELEESETKRRQAEAERDALWRACERVGQLRGVDTAIPTLGGKL